MLRLVNDFEQKGQGKLAQKLARKMMQRNNEKTDEGIEERVGEGVSERIKVRIDDRIKGGVQREERNDGSIRCICACNVERGEMVCCNVCERWTHLGCLGMKEGVGGMEGKECVPFLCVSVFAGAEEGSRVVVHCESPREKSAGLGQEMDA